MPRAVRLCDRRDFEYRNSWHPGWIWRNVALKKYKLRCENPFKYIRVIQYLSSTSKTLPLRFASGSFTGPLARRFINCFTGCLQCKLQPLYRPHTRCLTEELLAEFSKHQTSFNMKQPHSLSQSFTKSCRFRQCTCQSNCSLSKQGFYSQCQPKALPPQSTLNRTLHLRLNLECTAQVQAKHLQVWRKAVET